VARVTGLSPAASAAIVSARCNPYGHETGGPRHLMGGVYGPAYEGEHKWVCHNIAVVRARMICPLGHRGQEMLLCRPHAIEIQARQSGLCTRCAWPPEALMHNEAIEKWQQELAVLNMQGRWESDAARRIRQQVETAGHRMTELLQTGVIKRNPLTLTEVS
jgi:hypothetical protein